MIPFSSEIKFNMFIRDMRKSNYPHKTDFMLVMKGAPERILSRCSKILIDGEEVEYTEARRKDIEFSNSSLGKMGERVLAIARYNLEPSIYG
jgi:sodium/potassium-transporting ATPase subunit alpha